MTERENGKEREPRTKRIYFLVVCGLLNLSGKGGEKKKGWVVVLFKKRKNPLSGFVPAWKITGDFCCLFWE